MESKRKYFVLVLFLLLALMIFAFANPIVEESTDFKDSDNKTEEVEKPEVIIDTDKEDNNNYVPVVRPVRPVQKEETTEETVIENTNNIVEYTTNNLNPKTGDTSIALYVAIALLSVAGLVVTRRF